MTFLSIPKGGFEDDVGIPSRHKCYFVMSTEWLLELPIDP